MTKTMSNLFDEVSEAREYCESIVENVEKYLLFDGEEFASLQVGVFASTGVDLQGEELGLESLEAIVQRVEKERLWVTLEHNPLIQPVGRVIAAKLFVAPKSGVYFVAGVCGIYDPTKLKKFSHFSIDTSKLDAVVDVPEDIGRQDLWVQVGANRHELDISLLETLVSQAPTVVRRDVEYHFRKGLDATTILTVVVPIYLLLKTPFLKKYQERLGEHAADATIGFLKWFTNNVAGTIAAMMNRRVLYELRSPYRDSYAQFLIDSKELSVVRAAVDSIEEAARSATNLIDQLQSFGVEHVVYVFDHKKTKAWLPLYAVTRSAGVVSDQPYLISVERYHGLSLGGSVGHVEKFDEPKGKEPAG